MHVCVCARSRHKHTHAYNFICMYVCMYVYTYIHVICTCTHKFTYIYLYACMHVYRGNRRSDHATRTHASCMRWGIPVPRLGALFHSLGVLGGNRRSDHACIRWSRKPSGRVGVRVWPLRAPPLALAYSHESRSTHGLRSGTRHSLRIPADALVHA